MGYTEEIAYGLSPDQVKYPTPTVGCVEGGEQSDRVEKTATGSYILRKKNKPHMTYGAKLSDAILFEEKQKRDMWATPNTLDHMPPRSKEAMERQFATTRKGRTKPSNLREQVHPDMWPTPVAHEARLGYQRRDTGKKGSQKSLSTLVIDDAGGRDVVKGQLNPTWVEWLMGYPEDYTLIEEENE